MTTALELVTGPATTVLTVDDVKAHGRIAGTDQDTVIANLIYAVEAHVDALGDLGRAMITQTWAQWERQAPGDVMLKMGPFQSLTSVEYYDADGVLQTATVDDFEIRKKGDFVICRPKSDKAWPTAQCRDDAIKITYVAGFGNAADDVPQAITQAMLMLLSHWYENREAASEARLMETPMGYQAIMNNQRVGWFG